MGWWRLRSIETACALAISAAFPEYGEQREAVFKTRTHLFSSHLASASRVSTAKAQRTQNTMVIPAANVCGRCRGRKGRDASTER